MDIEDMPIEMDEQEMAGPSACDSDSDSDDNDDAGSTKKKRKKTVTSKLPLHLKGLMGEANLRFVRGDLATAKKMCYEVIRNCPDAFEPYLTLSQMYENKNRKKYRGYLLLASHLFPAGIDIWCRLADSYLQENQPMQAIKCYTSAMKNETAVKNMELHYKRLELVEKHCKETHVIRCKQCIANHLPRKQYDKIIKICMDLAKELFIQGNYIRSIEVLDIPFRRVPDKVTDDLLNMMLESLLACERFTECLDIFVRFCHFEFDVFVQDDQKIVINSYTIPPSLQVDLKIKFVICVIKLKSNHLVTQLIDEIVINDDVELYGDLYLDVIEALMPGMPQEALKLLIPLIKSKNFSLAAIWLKYAECLSMCNMIEQAIEAYFTVMSLAPQHIEVLYPLAMLLLKQDKQQEALDVLSLDLTTNKLDVVVLMERMKLLQAINDFDEYWKSAELLLSRHCVVLKHPEELKCVTTMMTVKEKMAKIRKMRQFRGDDPTIETDFESIREPSNEEEYKFYRSIMQYAKDCNNFVMFQKFAFMGLCSKKFTKYFDEILLCAFYASVLNNDHFHAYSLIRDRLLRNNFEYAKSMLTWNWFNVILQTPDDLRHVRFLERHEVKLKAPPMRVIEANYDVSVGNYMAGLTFFMQEYKKTQSAYSAFMLGVIMVQLYTQKYNRPRKKLMAETSSYLFMNYAKTRSKEAEQEVFYNLGRMYQQLGVMYLAEFYYNKVFEVNNDFLEQHPKIVCLKREAAFNLHIMYKYSGNYVAARNILMQHIVV